jgi:hypothetical protein
MILLDNDLVRASEALCDTDVRAHLVDTAKYISLYLAHHCPEIVAFDAAKYFSKHKTSKIPRAYASGLDSCIDPVYKWIIQSEHHYSWMLSYGFALSNVYEVRFFERHKSALMFESLPVGVALYQVDSLPFDIQGCQEHYKQCFRVNAKSMTWTFHKIPEWIEQL